MSLGKILVRKAETIAELGLAAWIRCSVFADEFAYLVPENYPAAREVDGFDLLPTTVNFLATVDGEPAATARLLFPNAEVAARCHVKLGLSIEHYLDLQGIRTGVTLAEIPRSSVLKTYRHSGVMQHIYRAAYQESVRRGVTHWVALANMATDCELDAMAAHLLLKARGWHVADFNAQIRTQGRPASAPRYPLYGSMQRDRISSGDFAGVRAPRPLEIFATRMCARYFGSPVYDAEFRMFAMPLILDLSDFAASPYGAPPTSEA